MNQISLYNKSTDSKLSIEPEELNKNRTIKIPKDGDFFLTNKSKIVEDVSSKYTVGPNGDFQELEEAIRVLCNMRQYSSVEPIKKTIELELLEDYVFKPYFQSGMNAGFIIVRSRNPINIELNKSPYALFTFNNGAIGPTFRNITFNIKLVESRLIWTELRSYSSFENCNFIINYQDNVNVLSHIIFVATTSSTLFLRNIVFDVDINKNNDKLLNNGKKFDRFLCITGIRSAGQYNNVKLRIREHSNKHDDSYTRIFDVNQGSYASLESGETLIDFSSKHGTFTVVSANHEAFINMPGRVKITASSNMNNRSVLVQAYENGVINCEDVNLLNSGNSTPILYGFQAVSGSKIYIRGYKNNNSNITNITNIPPNTYSSEASIIL